MVELGMWSYVVLYVKADTSLKAKFVESHYIVFM